jgi:hypothetical protein
MKTREHEKDYQKVMDVLNSCESDDHTQATKRYFELYMFRWRHLLHTEDVNDLRADFSERLKSKEKKLNENSNN